MPQVPLLTREERGTLESKIQSDGQYSLSLFQIKRKLKKLKEALLIGSGKSTSELVQLEESLQSLERCQYMELFPDTLISEVYSKAKLNRPFERLIYDEMEDCLVSVLYAINGEYEWRHSIPCQIPFGDFCNKHQDLRSFTVVPRSYKLEEHRSQVIDKKYFHLLGGGGLFSCGLPSVLGNVKEPQGTLYMDGNTFIMRAVKKESKIDIELITCFEDGLIACFYIMGNGSISLQLSSPNGNTIEMDSHGFIYMCNTYTDFQSQMTCRQQSEKLDPNSKNSENVFGDPTACFCKKVVEGDCWRCVLPSGTVLCDQKNGELVAMFRNGNISEYSRVKSQSCQWTTTNSQGYQVVQEEGVISHEDPSGDDGFYAPQGVDVQRFCVDRGEDVLAAKSDAAISEMDKSRAPKVQSQGPIPRFFVLHEGGSGYELFGPDTFDNDLGKIQREEHSLHICEEYKSSPNKVFLHTFLRRLGKNSRDFQSSLPCDVLKSTCETWPSKKIGLEGKLKHCAHMKRATPISYKLPQVLLRTPSCKPVNKDNELFVSYRHIREYSTMDDAQSMEMDQYLAKLREWTVDSLTPSSSRAGDKLQQDEDVKSEIIQVSATLTQSGCPEDTTTLDGEQETMRITNLIMEELQGHLQLMKARREEDEGERVAASNRAISKLSRVVAKNLLEEIMEGCCRWTCTKQDDVSLYFRCEEGLQAWLKAQEQEQEQEKDMYK